MLCRLLLLATALQLPTHAAALEKANDLTASAARFGGSSRFNPAPPLVRARKRQSIELPPADAVPEPEFATTMTRTERAAGDVVARAFAVVALVIAAQTLKWSLLHNARSMYPLTTATACAFLLYGASDALSQCASQRRPGAAARHSSVALDLRRLLRTALTAAFLSGFCAVFYFAWLERALPAGLGVWAVLGKIGVDIGVYEPLYDTLYITLQALLRGEGLCAARDEVSKKVLKVWRMAPYYWGFADALNFGLVPLRLRPMTNAVLSIPWGMYISSVANKAETVAMPAVQPDAARPAVRA